VCHDDPRRRRFPGGRFSEPAHPPIRLPWVPPPRPPKQQLQEVFESDFPDFWQGGDQ
jgi:hypothetical protein